MRQRSILATFIVAISLTGCGDSGTSPEPTHRAEAPSPSPPSPPPPSPPPPDFGPGVTDLLDEESPFAAATAPPPRACSARDRAAAMAVARRLREVDYPYHLQAIALSPAFASGCRALIIAEPPPLLSVEQLQAVSPQLFATTEINEHRIGYDGWTRDVVVTLPKLSKRELAELVASLHLEMFGTTHGMQALDTSLPPPRHDPATAPLDLAVGPAELVRWLMDENPPFMPLRSDNAIEFRDLLQADEPEVFVDGAGQLVAWIIPRHADIANMAGVFRKFTLASDVIVGAIASSHAVAVIARRRITDQRVVQPLRFETISLLAAVDKDQLQQSYDRTNLLSGRTDDGRDWAPIFLSPELEDTEYGSLLDITDQLLKSWSNRGTTRYINFAFPAPRVPWPFPRPAYDEVPTKGGFRYNWNTENSGGVVRVDDRDIFWLRRTGALNVSYFSHDGTGGAESHNGMQGLEEQAYRFFTQTQTPLLIRVVQYNALFQIFNRFGLKSSLQLPLGSQSHAKSYLRSAARDALVVLRRGDKAQIRAHLEPTLGASLNEAIFARITRQTSPALASLDDDELNELATVLATPRDVDRYPASIAPALRALERLRFVFPMFARPKLWAGYASMIEVQAGTWIHTPSIVISWNTGKDGRAAIGGHDLVAKVPTIRLERSAVGLGAIQKAAGKSIDTVGAHELERLALGPSGPTLADAAVVRPARQALGIPQARRIAPVAQARHTPPVSTGGSVRVARVADGYRVVGENGVQHKMTTMPEVVELVGSRRGVTGKSMKIEFDGFTADEARGVMRAAEVRSNARLAGVIKDAPEFATRPIDFSNARIYNAQVRRFSDGAGQIGIAVEVPMEARPSLWIRIKITFRDGSPQWLNGAAAKVQRLVKEVLAKLARKPSAAQDVGVELQRQLKALLPEGARFEVKLKHELHDVTIVQRDPGPGRGTDRRAG